MFERTAAEGLKILHTVVWAVGGGGGASVLRMGLPAPYSIIRTLRTYALRTEDSIIHLDSVHTQETWRTE